MIGGSRRVFFFLCCRSGRGVNKLKVAPIGARVVRLACPLVSWLRFVVPFLCCPIIILEVSCLGDVYTAETTGFSVLLVFRLEIFCSCRPL